MPIKYASQTPNWLVFSLVTFVASVLVVVSFFGPVQQQKDATLPASTVPPATLTLLFAGDMQWDRYIRQVGEQKGYDFVLKPITPQLQAADVVIANLEGPVTTFASKSVNSMIGSSANYIFTFSPEILPVLLENNITMVNLGNNHITNFGNEGIIQTKQQLDMAGIAYFGNTGGDSWLEDSFLEYSQGTIRVLFVNYNQFIDTELDTLLAEIARRAPGYTAVILYTHWGEEYQTHAGSFYTTLAATFIDAGVTAIIGSHPHVVQQMEYYKGKPVYYSLGNFVFDQYFSANTQEGLLVTLDLSETGEMTVTELPIFLEASGQTIFK